MPLYHQLGEVPKKRHSIFRRPDGELYREELVGNFGFNGPSSLLYRREQPTAVLETRHVADLTPRAAATKDLRHRHVRTARIASGGDWLRSRTPLFFNNDVVVGFTRPDTCGDFFYRNGQSDELLFVSDGEGVLESALGDLPYRKNDYLVVPRGIVHRLVPKSGSAQRILTFECAGYVTTPKRYRNQQGQLKEGAPFCERDLRRPQSLRTVAAKGAFTVFVKHAHQLHEYTVANHPFDVVGWDGYYYPFAFNADDFEPQVGRFHLPPPVHQTFETDGAVFCTFARRPFDFDKTAVPAPYFHSNAMSDELIYYASSEFMSRTGVEYGSITLHPDGIPHGPQPGRTEASIGVPGTDELAIMCDTFRPLTMAAGAEPIEDREYYRSWSR
jgi:homogentisate 1,2-dioxygenase